MENKPENNRPGLRPTLGFYTTLLLVIGGVIGSGIFRKTGTMAGQLGSPEWLLGVWLIAGVITLLGALTNAEAAGMFPSTGGQYVFFEKMYGPFFAFLYGWAAFIVFQTGSISAVAYVFAEYGQNFITLPDLPGRMEYWTIGVPFIGDIQPAREFGVKGLACALIVLLTVVNYIGVRFGGVVSNIFTVAKVGGMAALCILIFAKGKGASVDHFTRDLTSVNLQGLAFWVAVAAALQGAFWAYDGWNKVTYIAGEVKDPQRNVPHALILGMLAVTGIYLVMNVAYLYALPMEKMASSRLVAADAAQAQTPNGAKWIAVAVMISTFGAANAIILASARVYFQMGREGVLPKAFGQIQPQFRTPGDALMAQCFWAIILVFSGTFDMLTDTLIFVSWIFYGATALGIIILRYKMPEHPRPFKVPFYPVVPIIFILFSALFLVLTAYNDYEIFAKARAEGRPALLNSVFGLALVFAGAPIYFYYRLKAKVKA